MTWGVGGDMLQGFITLEQLKQRIFFLRVDNVQRWPHSMLSAIFPIRLKFQAPDYSTKHL